MKNKKGLGIIIALVGGLISVASFIYTSSLKIILPTCCLTSWEILLHQFNESNLLIPFIFGLILIVVGIIIFSKEIFKKKK